VQSLKILVMGLALWAPPALALADAPASSHPPCGASGGGLGDPSETHRCLAERYKPPKAKTPPTIQPPPPPPAEQPATN
jgi:hypothetical protein